MRAPAPPALTVIASDMQAVDRLIQQPAHRRAFGGGGVAAVAAGGKRLRPALLLLTAGALNYAGTELGWRRWSAHPYGPRCCGDVVDESSLRREHTANARFGKSANGAGERLL